MLFTKHGDFFFGDLAIGNSEGASYAYWMFCLDIKTFRFLARRSNNELTGLKHDESHVRGFPAVGQRNLPNKPLTAWGIGNLSLIDSVETSSLFHECSSHLVAP